jgi:hypothetical protein
MRRIPRSVIRSTRCWAATRRTLVSTSSNEVVMSSYAFHGNLRGVLCGECSEPLSGVKVRLYRLRSDQDAARLAVAEPKDTFRVLPAEEIDAKLERLIAEVDTDDKGGFVVRFDEGSRYQGEAFELDVYCGTVPHRLPVPPPRGPVQFSVTTVQPQWRERKDGNVAVWEHALSQRFWCFIRSLFDAWTICGRVTVCGTQRPASGVRVFAFDRDWLSDDPLGIATTDGDGRFRIDYLGANFRRGTWLNVELVGGPDVYFRLESPSGEIVQEPPSTGRNPGRENIGPCFCVALCVKEEPIVSHAWFTRVGEFNINSDISPTTGLTLAAQPAGFPNEHGGPGFGFWSTLKLVGDCPTTHPVTGAALRYRFGTRPSGSLAAPTWLTGSAVVAIKVGTRPVPWNFGSGSRLYPQDIVVAGSGGLSGTAPMPPPAAPPGPPPGSWGSMPPLILQPDADGWVTMPPGATNQGFSGPLIYASSQSFAPGGAAPGSGAGNAVAAPKSGVDVEIVFEAAPMPGGAGATLSNTLPRLHVNNWSEVAEATVAQLTLPGTTPCSAVTTALDLSYTMDHELVASWGIGLVTSATIPGGFPVFPGGTTPRGGFVSHHLDITPWPECAYQLTFSRKLKLTDGERPDSGRTSTIALFCKRT